MNGLTVGIPVPYLAEAVDWYRELLPGAKEATPRPGMKEFEIMPGVWLQLIQDPYAGPSSFVVRFGVEDIKAEHSRIRDFAANVDPISDVPNVVRYFNFTDPYGNRLSCYQAF